MEDCYPVSTPIDRYHALTPSEFSEPKANIVEYQIQIGSVMYVMVGTRPDIAFAVSKLSYYGQNLSVRH